jgi:hypothetical protein
MPDWNGIPLNPDIDGWHWLSSWVNSPGWESRMPWCAKWNAERKAWAEVEADESGGLVDWSPARVAAEFNYMAPCLTPSEIDAIVDAKMITLHQAQQIRTFIRDLEDIDCNRANMSDQFLADQDDEVREFSWRAALDMAESMIKGRLRKLGVDV